MTERPLSPENQAFLDGVKAALERLDGERTICTQDEIDVFLLGGTIPPWPIPKPKADCFDCRGTGWVCKCHGLEGTWAYADHGGVLVRCRCVPKPGRPSS